MAKAMGSTSKAVVVLTAETPEVMEGVQATYKAEGSIIKQMPVPEKAKEDHVEGMSWQCKQLKCEVREATMDYMLPAAEEVVVRALGEDSDMQEVPGATAMATVAEPVTMEGVQRTEEETVPRQE